MVIYATLTPPSTDSLIDWVIFLWLKYWPMFLQGMKWTLVIALSGTIIGLFIAMLLTPLKIQTSTKRDTRLIKILKKVVVILTTIYVEVLRGTPMIVQSAVIFYGLLSKHVDIITSGIIIVSINTSAYLIEVLRGSINAIDKGQMEAARSIGMTRFQAMRHIIIPQAIKNSIPMIGNEFVINIKDTAVLNVIAVTELFYVTGHQIMGKYYRSYEGYVIAAALYLVMTLTTTRILYFVSSRLGTSRKSFPTSQNT